MGWERDLGVVLTVGEGGLHRGGRWGLHRGGRGGRKEIHDCCPRGSFHLVPPRELVSRRGGSQPVPGRWMGALHRGGCDGRMGIYSCRRGGGFQPMPSAELVSRRGRLTADVEAWGGATAASRCKGWGHWVEGWRWEKRHRFNTEKKKMEPPGSEERDRFIWFARWTAVQLVQSRFNLFSRQLTGSDRNCDGSTVEPAGPIRFLKLYQRPPKKSHNFIFITL